MTRLKPDNQPCLLVNQTIGPLFLDIISVARERCRVSVFRGVKYVRRTTILRVVTWIGFSLQLSFHLISRGRSYRSLLVVSNPPSAPLLAPLACRPYSLLLYDLYPHVLTQLCPANVFQRIFLRLIVCLWHSANRFVLPRADRVFTLSEKMASQIRPYFASEYHWRERVKVIPPWADTTKMRPRPADAEHFRRNHQIQGLLLSYSGNFGLTHPLEILLEASALLEALPSPPVTQFLLIGDGPKLASLSKQSHQLQLPLSRLRFLDRMPYSELPVSLSAADLAVVALDGPASGSSLPSKTFNAMACGTPILALAPADSALAQLVHYHNCGFVIEPGPNASWELSDLVIRLANDTTQLQLLAINALDASSQYTIVNATSLVDAWLSVVHAF